MSVELEQGNVRRAVPFLHVRDMAVSVRFYVDGLGFTMTKRWEPNGELRWCLLQRGPTELMLQSFVREGPHANVPQGTLGLGISICFICDDALALFHEFSDRRLEPSLPFVGNAMWVTSLADPDGYRLEFESDTDAAEESVYEPPEHRPADGGA